MISGRTVFAILAATQLWACHGDRETLFAIRRGLEVGMSRSAVEAIIERHRTPALHSQANAAEGREWLRITSEDSCILTVGFTGGRLTNAELRDEDSIYTPCDGAPPDLK